MWDEWYRVRPALEKLIAKNPEFRLNKDHVFAECATDESQLWVTPEAFVVTKFVTDDYEPSRTLFIWVAASFEGQRDVGAKYLDFFDGVAKYMNCKYIEFWSSRVGMERYIKPRGFTPYYKAYRKAV